MKSERTWVGEKVISFKILKNSHSLDGAYNVSAETYITHQCRLVQTDTNRKERSYTQKDTRKLEENIS